MYSRSQDYNLYFVYIRSGVEGGSPKRPTIKKSKLFLFSGPEYFFLIVCDQIILTPVRAIIFFLASQETYYSCVTLMLCYILDVSGLNLRFVFMRHYACNQMLSLKPIT